MSKKIVWTKHKSDDIWRGGPCDSVKECVEEARLEGYKDTDTFALGYAELYQVTYVNSDMIIEYLQQDAADNIGEVADDWLNYVTHEQRAELESRVLKVVQEWLEYCGEKPTFYKVLPFDELTLGETLEKYGFEPRSGGAGQRAKYRKKPVEVEAIQWTGDNITEIYKFANKDAGVDLSAPGQLCIETLEGVMHAAVGDYIIKGVQGEFYPCKPDIFEQTYEASESVTEWVDANDIRKSKCSNCGIEYERVMEDCHYCPDCGREKNIE